MVLESDWHQAGMYNSPCLTTIYELTGSMPCHRSLWDAKDADEFNFIINTTGPGVVRRPYSVRSCVEDLMRDDFAVPDIVAFRRLNPSDLGLVIGGKQT